MVQINTLNPSCGCEYGKTQHIVTLIYLFYHMLWLSNKPSQRYYLFPTRAALPLDHPDILGN